MHSKINLKQMCFGIILHFKAVNLILWYQTATHFQNCRAKLSTGNICIDFEQSWIYRLQVKNILQCLKIAKCIYLFYSLIYFYWCLTSLGSNEIKSRWNCGSITDITWRTWVGSQRSINSSRAILFSAGPQVWWEHKTRTNTG